MKLTIIFISTLITYAAALDCMGCVQMFNDCRKVNIHALSAMPLVII